MSVERPCPNETVIFICTVNGSSLRWQPSDVSRITVLNTADLNVPQMPQPGYFVTLTAFENSAMTMYVTSTLSRTAEDGINVSCIAITPSLTTVGYTTIDLAGEKLPVIIISYTCTFFHISNSMHLLVLSLLFS